MKINKIVAIYSPEELTQALDAGAEVLVTAPGLVQVVGISYLIPMRELVQGKRFIIDLGQAASLGIAALAAGFRHMCLEENAGFAALQGRVDAYRGAVLYCRGSLGDVFPLYAEVAQYGEKTAYQNLQKWLKGACEL